MVFQSLPSTTKTSSIHLPYEYALKLNNNAALLIDYGHYHRAESSLTKALHLLKLHIEKRTLEVCSCYHCTLDGCIIFTEDSHRGALHARESEINKFADNLVVNQTSSENSCSSHSPNHDSYVYRRPIRVPCLQISEGHNMGPVLSLIITFNLGLGRHLRAMEEGEHTQRRALLEKSLRLYEVAYKFLKQCYNGRDKHLGIQFKTIICNNLCHVHRTLNGNNTGNSSISTINDYSTYTHQDYHKGLLSALMCVLERKVGQTSSENDSNNIHIAENCPKTRFIDLEGFWRTVDHLVLSAQCADVA